MATCTIVVTQNSDSSINVTSTDAASFNLFIPNEGRQARRIGQVITGLVEAVLTLK